MIRGLTLSDNAFGFRVARVHYSCLPDRDPLNPDPILAQQAKDWLENQRRQWPDPNDFEREFEISFYSGQGARVFPQFTTNYHIAPLTFNKYKVIYRGWDFGWHAPVCLFAQIDPKDRLCLLQEIVGNQQTTSDFAKKVIQRSAEWFPNHVPGFEDYCDPAGQQVKSVESEKSERRDIEVLGGLGIYPKYQWGWSRKDGRSLIHQLLNIRSDTTPSLYVDDRGCALLAQAFLGRYVYPTHTDGTINEDPDDKSHPWADVMAALRYLVIGLHPRLGVSRFQLGKVSNFVSSVSATHGYGTRKRGS